MFRLELLHSSERKSEYGHVRIRRDTILMFGCVEDIHILLTTKYEKQNVVAIDTTVPDTVGARRRKRRRRPRRDQSRADDTTDGFTLGAIGSIARHVRNSSRRRGRRVDPVPIGRRCVASGAYVNVAILDFGSALLRGMGWTGGSVDYPTNNSNRGGKGDRNGPVEKMANPRLHRLGLGAKPSLSPPSAGRGLNRIMIQMEGATEPASVAKHMVGGPGEESILGNMVERGRARPGRDIPPTKTLRRS